MKFSLIAGLAAGCLCAAAGASADAFSQTFTVIGGGSVDLPALPGGDYDATWNGPFAADPDPAPNSGDGLSISFTTLAGFSHFGDGTDIDPSFEQVNEFGTTEDYLDRIGIVGFSRQEFTIPDTRPFNYTDYYSNGSVKDLFYDSNYDFPAVSFGAPGEIYRFTISSVPEPATWALMLVGLGGLGGILRSKRRAALA